MKNVGITVWFVIAVLIIAAGQGFSTIDFKDGGTHDINSAIGSGVRVDYQTPSVQTTVNLLEGGSISQYVNFQGYNKSIINILGGTVSLGLRAYDNSHVTMSAGSVQMLYAYGHSWVTMGGGTVTSLYAFEKNKITISGGNIGTLATMPSTQATISISGGSVSKLFADSMSQITIEGSNFAINGSAVGFGNIHSGNGQLTGTLANGDILNTQFQIGEFATVTLIPEPATIGLLGLGAVVLRKRKA